MRVEMRSHSPRRYDMPTAITFLLAGLGLGSLLTIVFSPRSDRERPAAMGW
jgi:hypothetical protein